MEDRRGGDAPPASAVEIHEPVFHVAEQDLVVGGRAHTEPVEDAARSRHASTKLYEEEPTHADHLCREQDAHGYGHFPGRVEGGDGQGKPTPEERGLADDH